MNRDESSLAVRVHEDLSLFRGSDVKHTTEKDTYLSGKPSEASILQSDRIRFHPSQGHIALDLRSVIIRERIIVKIFSIWAEYATKNA